MLRLNIIDRSCSRGSTTNMERTHRELRTRLTDGLGSDYTNGFANIDKVAATQIATIAVAADPISCLTCDRAANFNLVHTH